MRGTLQYRFTTARVQWPCSTDIHWACLITQSGPARYVPKHRLELAIERSKVEIKLRVRDADTNIGQNHRVWPFVTRRTPELQKGEGKKEAFG